MGEALKKWLKMSKDLPVREEVGLNLRVAVNMIDSKFDKLFEAHGITTAQYNVLRILKGVYPKGHARCEIASRMIERASDITRIIDRLEKQDLVERDRTSEDRRISITRITEKGIEVLNKLNKTVEQKHNEFTNNLNESECRQLSLLLEKLYEKEI